MRNRRRLPESWKEIPVRRRVLALRALLEQPDKSGRLEAVRVATDIPMSTWRRMTLVDRVALLERCPWASVDPKPILIFEEFKHRGVWYAMPSENFMNAVCLEYPLADGYLSDYLQSGSRTDLLHLVATICRELDDDTEAAAKRGDRRAKLHSRSEIELRALKLRRLPDEIATAVLLYFIGVKQLVHRMYGSWLFDIDEEEEDQKSTEKKGDPLGWWGLYLDAAQGDITKLEAIHQSSFHDFCLMEVRRRKNLKEAEMRHRLNTGNP